MNWNMFIPCMMDICTEKIEKKYLFYNTVEPGTFLLQMVVTKGVELVSFLWLLNNGAGCLLGVKGYKGAPGSSRVQCPTKNAYQKHYRGVLLADVSTTEHVMRNTYRSYHTLPWGTLRELNYSRGPGVSHRDYFAWCRNFFLIFSFTKIKIYNYILFMMIRSELKGWGYIIAGFRDSEIVGSPWHFVIKI
jgi:hypothetical protein